MVVVTGVVVGDVVAVVDDVLISVGDVVLVFGDVAGEALVLSATVVAVSPENIRQSASFVDFLSETTNMFHQHFSNNSTCLSSQELRSTRWCFRPKSVTSYSPNSHLSKLL